MARIKIELPEHFIFSTKIKVRISDVNYGGHVGNDAILSMLHTARLEFLQSLGYSELDVEGVSLIMTDSAIVYKGESFFGDELTVQVTPEDFSRMGFDLKYRIVNQDEKEIAHAKTGMLCFDYEQRKVASLPEKALEKMNA